MLTKRQRQILNFINDFSKKHGFAPSHEEIKKHFRLRAVSTINQHLIALENKGYLQKQKNQPRGVKVTKSEKLVKIPLLGTIAAGQPIEAIQQNETIVVQQNLFAKSGEHYALKVAGDSMIDEGIFDGDTVIIHKQSTVENGETAVALINGEATLKKIYKEKNRIKLQPANPNFKPIFVKDIDIQGKVTGIVRQFKKPENLSAEFHELTIKYLEETEINYRKSLGQYFTPKSIKEALLDKLPHNIKNPKILDPACGTGEFLLTAKKYFKNAELYGWDIDKKLVEISKKIVPEANLKNTDALFNYNDDKFDFVIGNPPYFELIASEKIKKQFCDIINGRTNIFSLFVYQGLNWLKDGGYLAYVIPPSMNNGAYFSKLRNFIVHNANIEYLHILKNPKLFSGALQSTMLLVLKKGQNKGDYIFKKNGVLIFSEGAKYLDKIFKDKKTLHDLNYSVKTGRLVWNQNRHILTDKKQEGVPLIWAHNIGKKRLNLPINKNGKPQYVKTKNYDVGPAIVVNRITGSLETSELRAAVVPAGMKFIAENHVNVIYPPSSKIQSFTTVQNIKNPINLEILAEQLCSKEKTEALRNITGNTQISKNELEKLFPISI